MKSFLLYAGTLIVLFALSSVLHWYWLSAPNLLLVFILVSAVRAEEKLAFLWLAFWGGLLLDTSSSGIFGLYTLACLIIVLIIYYSVRTFISADKSLWTVVGICAVGYLIFVGIFHFANSVAVALKLQGVPFSAAYLDQKIWLDLLFNSIAVLPLFFWSEYVDSKILKAEQNKHIPHV